MNNPFKYKDPSGWIPNGAKTIFAVGSGVYLYYGAGTCPILTFYLILYGPYILTRSEQGMRRYIKDALLNHSAGFMGSHLTS